MKERGRGRESERAEGGTQSERDELRESWETGQGDRSGRSQQRGNSTGSWQTACVCDSSASGV